MRAIAFAACLLAGCATSPSRGQMFHIDADELHDIALRIATEAHAKLSDAVVDSIYDRTTGTLWVSRSEMPLAHREVVRLGRWVLLVRRVLLCEGEKDV